MKKGLLISLILVLLVVVTGCGNKKEKSSDKTFTCTMNGTVVEGTEIKSTYKVSYTGDYVDLVEGKEVVTSDNDEMLKAYKTTVEAMYSPYKDLKYYDYKVELKDKTLTSTTKINYAKLDTNKMIEINSANSTMIKDGKVAVSDIRKVYEDMGATCK